MNKRRRTELERIYEKLTELRDELDMIREEEQEAFDNMPESIQYSERGETMESIISNLEDIYSSIDEACDGLTSYEDV